MNIYEKILEFKKRGISAMLVTVVDKHGEGPVEVGKKMIVGENEEAFGTVGGGALEFYARELCKDLVKQKKNLKEQYLLSEGKVIPNATTLPMVCGGLVSLFYEFIGSKESIILFGAGHVSQAVCHVLKTMNFHISVIDERPEVIGSFIGADLTFNMPFVSYIEEYSIKEGSFVVVCTPSHKYDYHVINKILELKLKPKYIGMLCSSEKLKDYLAKTYEAFGDDIDLSNFYSPIGLDLGGGSPEEIAISIASEILAISNQKTGHKHLRESGAHGKHRYWENKLL